MNKAKKILSITTVMLVLPVLALAAFSSPQEPGGSFSDFGTVFGKVLSLIWPIVAGLAAIMIVAAGIIFITANGDPEKIQMARSALIWSVIGLVVAILAWSIPRIISTVIGG